MVKDYVPQQGDIILVNHSPTSGREKHGVRPALVVSVSLLSQKSYFVWCVPITTGKNPFITHIPLDNRTKTKGNIHVEQLRSFDYKSRQPKFLEKCPKDIMQKVSKMINDLSGVT